MHDRSNRLLVMRVALAILMALCLVVSASAPAAAQERVERKSILQLLFGGGRRAEKPAPSVVAPERASRPATKPRRSAAAAAVPPKPVVEKLENARRILVIGDFLADALSDGLKERFAESPGVVVIDKSNGSSGLVRDDYFDWPGQAGAIIAEINPSIVIVQLGSNDRQQLSVNGAREAVRSAVWLEEYGRRTDALIRTIVGRRVPLLWVGVPAFKSPAMTDDMVVLNGIYRTEVERAGAEFIDIWDGFVDEDGKFVFTGSDVSGQQARLRGSDGINLTPAGKRKLAFYVEKSARRLLGAAADSSIATLGPESLPDMQMPPTPDAPVDIVRTLPVAMTDPDLDGGTELLGAAPPQPALARSPRDFLVGQGIVAEAPEGRVDNFRWTRPLR